MAKKQLHPNKPKRESSATSKRAYISQTRIPKLPLSEAIRLAQGLHDNFAGKPVAPHQLALAVGISPTSSAWETICGASIAYGLTKGGYNAKTISLTSLGSQIVAPTEEGDDRNAKIEAILQPKIAQEFFERYNKAKFPQDKIARNVLATMGVPSDRLDTVLEILKTNGMSVGIIHDTNTGPFVAIDTPLPPVEALDSSKLQEQEVIQPEEASIKKEKPTTQTSAPITEQRVFITHGKNKQVVSQLKDILKFGKFIPVLAEEHETTSKPVPEKVLEDMRSCFAGIIHIESEDELLDRDGNTHHKINENVLIEIGAAMALYKHNFILLVQKGIHLPSNLHGLYRCDYEGDKLEYDATIKLLKAFNEFK